MFDCLSIKTDKKVLVIESDDWGSIRMSSKSSYENLLSKSHPVDSNPYHRLDGLESLEDILKLQALLFKFKDYRDKPVSFTLNYMSANPDFKKIGESDFVRYFRESIIETYNGYNGNALEIVNKVKEGESIGVFDVQFHGTEHLQINRWMAALQQGDGMVRQAFCEKVFCPAIFDGTGYSMEFMDALDYDHPSEIQAQINILMNGLDSFKQIWGKDPKSFIAPCYRWSKPIEEYLFKEGVKYIQGQRAQLHPMPETGYRQRKIYHYTGQRSEHGQIYMVRNVSFEPSLHGPEKSLTMAKRQIVNAFRWNAPAIVSSHRINYTSRLEKENRDNGLNALHELLSWVTKNYPEVEFHTSSSLGKILETKF